MFEGCFIEDGRYVRHIEPHKLDQLKKHLKGMVGKVYKKELKDTRYFKITSFNPDKMRLRFVRFYTREMTKGSLGMPRFRKYGYQSVREYMWPSSNIFTFLNGLEKASEEDVAFKKVEWL